MASSNSTSLQQARESERQRKKLFSDPQYEPFQNILARGGRIDAQELPLDMQLALGVKDGQKLRLARGGAQELIDAQAEAAGNNAQRLARLDEVAAMIEGSRRQKGGRGQVRAGGAANLSDVTANIPSVVSGVNEAVVQPQGVPSGREYAQSEIVGRKPGIKGVVNALIPEDVKRAANKFGEEFTFALSPALDTILRANQKDVVGSQGATGQVGSAVVEQLQRLMSDTNKSIKNKINKATNSQTAEQEILQALKEDPTFSGIFAPANKSKSAPRTIQDIAKMGGTGVRRTKTGRAYQITADGKLILQ